MPLDRERRDPIKENFETGDRPTEQQFSQLIDSCINQKDDGVYVDDSNINNPKIGIGTESPTEKLDVNGSINVQKDIKLTGHILGDGSGDPDDVMLVHNHSQIQLHGSSHSGKPGGIVIGSKKDDSKSESGKIIFSQNNVNGNWDTKMVLDHNGNIGIGTQSNIPTYALHIKNQTGSDTGLRLETGAGNNRVLMSNTIGDASWISKTDITDGLWKTGTNQGDIQNGNTGNVGIGTVNPTEKLHVKGNAHVEEGILTWNNQSEDRFTIRASDQKGSYIEFFKETSNNANAGGISFISQGDGEENGFSFWHNHEGNWNNSLRIDGNGNVGLGYTSPQHKLNVVGDSNFKGKIRIDNDTPMIKRRYNFGWWRSRETDNKYPPSKYDAIVVGIQFKDMGSFTVVDEHFMAYIEKDSSGSDQWIIEAKFPNGGGGHGGHKKSKIIDVLFIKREIIEVDQDDKNYL